MSGYANGNLNVMQYSFLPICFDELISEDNPVRVISAFVDNLNVKELGFKYSDLDKEKAGRPPYNPKDMLKLYMYGYFNAIRSSRKLEKECTRNIELFWLLNNIRPKKTAISDFRKDNINCMKGVFKAFSLLCDSLGLLGKEMCAIDGSKFRASNAKKKSYTKGKLEKQIKYYEESVENYLKILEAEDTEDTKNEGNEKTKKIDKAEVQKKITEIKKRIEELTEIKEDVEKNGEKSLTDPDSKYMKMNNNGRDICHNTQISVDSKAHLVIDADVTSSPTDQNQLYNMSSRAKETLNVETLKILCDKGYYNGAELKKCEENNIMAIVSVPKEKGKKGYQKTDFKYNEEKDVFVCPQGNELYRKGKKKIEYSNSKACNKCPNKANCTQSKSGRKITISEYDEYFQIAKQRLEDNMDLYKERQKIVEHVFGTVKRAFGFTYFLLRGNQKVKGETFMHFLTYNLKRVCNLKNINEIIEAIIWEHRKISKIMSKYFSVFPYYVNTIIY